jgi:thioredoxin-related protein
VLKDMASRNSLIALSIIVIALIGVVVYYYYTSPSGKQEANTPSVGSQYKGKLSCKGDQVMLEDGIYVYTKSGIEKISLKQLADLKGKHILMLFYNNQCPHCRAFEPTWCQLVSNSNVSEKFYMVKVVCDWFTAACTSQDSMALFGNMRVTVSPTLVIAKASGNSITGIEMLVPGDPVNFTYTDLANYLLSYSTGS